MIAEITRVKKWGKSHYLLLTIPILQHTLWRNGDKIVVRPQDGKLVLERIEMQSLARITAPGEVHDEG